MRNDNFLLKTAALAGLAIGTAAAIKVLNDVIDDLPPVQKEDTQQSFKTLIQNQTVVDELDGKLIADWFKENRTTEKRCDFVLAKPTEKNAQLFSLCDFPTEIDVEKSILQVVLDTESKNVSAIRLISYNTMMPELAQKIGDKEFTIVTEE